MNSKSTVIGGRAGVRLLRALARAHAFAEIDAQEGDVPQVRVYCGTGASDTFDVTHHAAWHVWQRVENAGLVERCGAAVSGRWSISALGRARLRDCRGEAGSIGRKAQAQNPVTMADDRGVRHIHGAPREAPAESPLAWLYRRRDKSGATIISQAQFEAGERLRTDYEIAQLMPRLTVDWTRAATGGARPNVGPQQGLELSERAVAARERVSRALKEVGPELASLLVDVCCHLKGLEQLERAAGWPQRSAKIVLQVALAALVRHYGLERRDSDALERDDRPARVRHWGADGFRPKTVVACDGSDGSKCKSGLE